jgi:hypothetical protein
MKAAIISKMKVLFIVFWANDPQKGKVFIIFENKYSKMKKSFAIFLIFLLLPVVILAQGEKIPGKRSFTAVFYNTENLFDINDDPATADEEFLPSGAKQWNEERYNKKIKDLSSVLSDMGGDELPGLIGLCEIENRRVLVDLISSPSIKKGKYEIVHFDSPDERGIDVALLVKDGEFALTDSKPVPVALTQTPDDKTRDILYARLRGDDGMDYHVFVNHWPSRGPGNEESEPSRVSAALTLRKEIDLVLNKDNNARIIVMGDFNDEPTNRSVFQILNSNSKIKNVYYRELYNLMFDLHNSAGEGSISYKNLWQMFDQIIVSQSLLKKNEGYYLGINDGKVFRSEKLLTVEPASGETVLRRTYSGNTYTGGVSDHLPVFAKFRKDKE